MTHGTETYLSKLHEPWIPFVSWMCSYFTDRLFQKETVIFSKWKVHEGWRRGESQAPRKQVWPVFSWGYTFLARLFQSPHILMTKENPTTWLWFGQGCAQEMSPSEFRSPAWACPSPSAPPWPPKDGSSLCSLHHCIYWAPTVCLRQYQVKQRKSETKKTQPPPTCALGQAQTLKSHTIYSGNICEGEVVSGR